VCCHEVLWTWRTHGAGGAAARTSDTLPPRPTGLPLLQDGWTSLHYAAREGQVHVVRALLEGFLGAAVDAVNKVRHRRTAPC
jgi:hypothetical protein